MLYSTSKLITNGSSMLWLDYRLCDASSTLIQFLYLRFSHYSQSLAFPGSQRKSWGTYQGPTTQIGLGLQPLTLQHHVAAQIFLQLCSFQLLQSPSFSRSFPTHAPQELVKDLKGICIQIAIFFLSVSTLLSRILPPVRQSLGLPKFQLHISSVKGDFPFLIQLYSPILQIGKCPQVKSWSPVELTS